MDIRQFVSAGIASVLLLGVPVLGPAPASASDVWNQQAIILIHVPLGGGTFFTTNHVFTANEDAPTTVNVKCFNEMSQRVGPIAGVTVELNAAGQLSQQTPTTLGVTNDPLFTGLGWCWANNIDPNQFDFNVLTTIGSTSDLSPGGLLNSAGSTLVAANSGLVTTSFNRGGIPYFNTSGGTAATYVFLLNPLSTESGQVSLQLYDAAGTAQGSPLLRTLSGRAIDVLSIPGVFELATPPVSGSITITTDLGGYGYTGWIIQVGNGKIAFTSLGLSLNEQILLDPADAPAL